MTIRFVTIRKMCINLLNNCNGKKKQDSLLRSKHENKNSSMNSIKVAGATHFFNAGELTPSIGSIVKTPC